MLPLLLATLLMTGPPQSTQPGSPGKKLSLTDAIAMVESDFGKRMRSHDGQSTGWHMMSRDAWKDVSERRRAKLMPTLPYTQALDYQDSSSYCGQYLSLLSEELMRDLKRKPTTREVLCCYRGGLTNFKRLDYNTKVYQSYLRAVEKYL